MSSPLGEPTTILLTGGTSGIGAVLLDRLLGRGHTVLALSRSAAHLPARAGLHSVTCDLTDLEALPGTVQALINDHPDLSVIINNAALQVARPLTDPASSPRDLIGEAAINLTAPAVIVQAALPHLMGLGQGAVINLSSGLATFPKQSGGLYSATKAGLSSFTTSLRWQLEGTRLLVSEVVLPLVDTPMTAGRGKGRKISPDRAVDAILRGIDARCAVIRVGAARVLPIIAALTPWLGRRMLRGD
jgi:uncharacterized oxidoreductase